MVKGGFSSRLILLRIARIKKGIVTAYRSKADALGMSISKFSEYSGESSPFTERENFVYSYLSAKYIVWCLPIQTIIAKGKKWPTRY